MSKEYIIPFVKSPEAAHGWISPDFTFDSKNEAKEFRDESLKANPDLEIKLKSYPSRPSTSEINDEVSRLIEKEKKTE